jgi:hypothetical protein
LPPDYQTEDVVLQEPLTKRTCTSAISTAPRKPWASQPTASSQIKKNMLLDNFHCTQEADGETGKIHYKKKDKDFFEDPHDNVDRTCASFALSSAIIPTSDMLQHLQRNTISPRSTEFSLHQ